MQRRQRRKVQSAVGNLAERKLALAAKGISREHLRRIAATAGVGVSPWRLYETVRREAAPLLYQETLQVEGGTKMWTLYDPTLLVSHVLSSCPALAEIYRAKLAEKPEPWRIVIGYDEHVPGDKLKTKNLRKSMVASFNFLELGEELLARDCTWFIPVVIRSS